MVSRTARSPRASGARRRGGAGRPTREWAARGALALAAFGIGYVLVTFSFAQAVASANPATAYRLAPYDGRIVGRYAGSLTSAEADAQDRARADRIARDALRLDPSAVAAVSTLGLNAQLRGDASDARRYFHYSEVLSRRDLQTQLWMIEDAVGRGDIAGALRHYDIALRTSPKVGELLFPVLLAASQEDAIRQALLRALARKPSWGEAFINFAAAEGGDPRALAKLFTGLRNAGVPVSEVARAGVINSLLAGGFVDEAWRYYRVGVPGARRSASRDPRFTAALTYPSRLDWTVTGDGTVTASIQRGEQGGILDFAGASGAIIRQTQVLPPGRYRLRGHSIGIDQPDRALPYWSLTCGGDGTAREIGRVRVERSSVAGGWFEGGFVVPPECPIQTLTLIARPTDVVAGSVGQIDQITLEVAP